MNNQNTSNTSIHYLIKLNNNDNTLNKVKSCINIDQVTKESKLIIAENNSCKYV